MPQIKKKKKEKERATPTLDADNRGVFLEELEAVWQRHGGGEPS